MHSTDTRSARKLAKPPNVSLIMLKARARATDISVVVAVVVFGAAFLLVASSLVPKNEVDIARNLLTFPIHSGLQLGPFCGDFTPADGHKPSTGRLRNPSARPQQHKTSKRHY